MPDPPIFPKREPLRVERKPVESAHASIPYAELHCLTNFSFLEGASHADELVARAVELGYHALAITDRNSLAGVVRAHAAAKGCGLKLLIGAEATPTDAPRVVLLATDRAAYGQLSRLLTVGRRRAEKGECQLTLDDIATHHAGLLALVAPERNPLLAGPAVAPSGTLLDDLNRYRELFTDRCYLLAELHYGTDDHQRLDELIRLSDQARVPLVAAGDVHYHARERMPLQHVLTAIRHGTTVAGLGERCLANAERHLRSLDEIEATFAARPELVRRTVEIADRCTFSLDELRYEYPEELAPPGRTPIEHLRQLAWQGARQRYPDGVPEKSPPAAGARAGADRGAALRGVSF